MKHRLGLTPGTPRFIAMRVADEEDRLPAKEHATYRRGVGTLLYLTKHSIPDLCNAVRELLKPMDRPAVLYLKRCSWFIQAFSDSDFAEDRETRRCVYGYFIYLCGIPIAWKSKKV